MRLISQTDRTSQLSAGRLEIFVNNTWGTVCQRGFDIEAAHVACRQLGFFNATAWGEADSVE